MFTELVPLLKQRTVMITLAMVGENVVRASVIPVGKTDAGEHDRLLSKPLTMTGTPEEMDAGFATELQQFVGSVLETGSNLEQLRAAQKSALASLDAEHRKSLAERKRIHTGGKGPSPAAVTHEKEGADAGADTKPAAAAPDPKPGPTDGLPLFAAPAPAPASAPPAA